VGLDRGLADDEFLGDLEPSSLKRTAASASTLFRDGALAQLGERRLCKPEVAGSIPARSTGQPCTFDRKEALVWGLDSSLGQSWVRAEPSVSKFRRAGFGAEFSGAQWTGSRF
jgi:hypothetical protein